MNYNENLKNLRISKNLLQKDMAKLCNVTTSAYQLWEYGKTQPDIKNLQLLADFFNVSVDFIIGRENDEGNIITVSPGLTDEEQRLIDYYRALPPELRAGVMSYTRTFYELDNNAKNRSKSHI